MPLDPTPSLRRMAALSVLLALGAQAAPGTPPADTEGRPRPMHKSHTPPQQPHQQPHPKPPAQRPHAQHPHAQHPMAQHPHAQHYRAQQPMPHPPHGQGMPGHRMAQEAPAGAPFSMAQHQAAMAYFAAPEHQGFVPPGLAKKGGLPPGQVRQWQRGRVLPAGVAYFALPRSLELVLGPPPAGHRYVRVATDILLLAIGTGIVVDAMEDLVR